MSKNENISKNSNMTYEQRIETMKENMGLKFVEEAKKIIKDCKVIKGEDAEENFVVPFEAVKSAYYVRLRSEDIAFAKGQVEGLFESFRELHRKDKPEDEFAFVTDIMEIGEINAKLKMLTDEGAEILGLIRIADC